MLGQAQAAPMGRLPRARPPRLPDVVLGVSTDGSSRVGDASGSARVACTPHKATAGRGAREAHGTGVMLWAGPGLAGTERVTHREDTHADWGLQQARHLEPSHPAAAGAGARPALSTATDGASRPILCRKPDKLLRTDRAPGVARALKDGQKGGEWLTAPDPGLRIVLSETAATLAGVRGGRGQRPPHAQRPACPTFHRLGAEPHPGSTSCRRS